MRINAVTQNVQAEFRKVENAKKTEKPAHTGRIVSSDQSIISSAAERLSTAKASIDAISASISQLGDVRSDKIAEIQQKIKNGYYDSPEFIDKLAVKLLAEFGLKV